MEIATFGASKKRNMDSSLFKTLGQLLPGNRPQAPGGLVEQIAAVENGTITSQCDAATAWQPARAGLCLGLQLLNIGDLLDKKDGPGKWNNTNSKPVEPIYSNQTNLNTTPMLVIL